MIVKVKEFEIICNFILDKKRRGWQIKYLKDNIFQIKSNQFMSDEKIILEMNKHYRFIKRCLSIQKPINYEKAIHVFGLEYELIITKSNYDGLLLLDDKAMLYTKNDTDEYNKKIVLDFYQKLLEEYILSVFDTCKYRCNIKDDIKIEYKNVKTYYGECYTKEKKIVFQKQLAKYDKNYILSVIYHELAHFYYKRHDDAFYNYLENLFPNYKRIQSNLRKTKYNDTY